jgi:hypothetical protein
VGSTVPQSDTGHLAQHQYSAGDGHIARVVRTVPGPDSQAVSGGWRGRDSLLTHVPMACQII